MSIMSKVKHFAPKIVKTGAITGAVVLTGMLGLHTVRAAHAATTYNCDANSVLWCGASSSSAVSTKYSNGDGHNSAGSIHNIYGWFGISSSDVSSMKSSAVAGNVTRSGDVEVNGKVVATNALTAGRENISGSKTVTQNGTKFYTRAPSVSFLNNSLSAMVVMKNGVFQFAILNSCGNPVIATPKPQPKPPTPPPAPKPGTLTCNTLTMTPGTIASNGDQTFSFEAQASASNATISTYVFNFGDNSSKTVTTSSTTASAAHSFVPGTYTATVTVTGTANGKSINAPAATSCKVTITVKKPTPPPTPPPAPKPGTLTCDNLTLTPGTADSKGNVPYTLSATASASNATITNYVFTFGDSSNNVTVTSSDTSASTTHSYAPGNWTASVTVNGTVNGKTTPETSHNCSGQVKVGQPPVTPVFACDQLTLSPTGQADADGNVAYTLSATASASNATITNYVFTFGDSSQDQTVTTGDTSATATHTYAPGTYTAQVTVTVTLADGTTKQVSADSCKAQITVASPTCTSPSGQTFPKGSNECQPAPTCTAPSGQTFPAGSAQCTPTTPPTTPSTPSTLPNTGPGDAVGLFSGVSMSGAGIHRILSNRRARRAVRR